MASRTIRKTIVGIKAESTRGTWNAPTSTDLFKVSNFSLPDISPEIIDWAPLRNTMTPEDYIVGNITGTMSFDVAMPLTFDGDVAKVQWLDAFSPIFQAAGMKIESSTITPDDDADTGLSVSVNIDGHEERLVGAGANLSIKYTAGEVAIMTVELTGVYLQASEETAVSGTPNGCSPQVVEDINTFTLSGTRDIVSCLASLEINMGVELNKFPCAQSNKGIKYYEIANRSVKASIQLASSDTATWDDDLDEDFRTGVTTTATLEPLGTGSGNEVVVHVTGKLTSKQGVDLEGNRFHDLELSGCGTAEGEIEITFEDEA